MQSYSRSVTAVLTGVIQSCSVNEL